MDLLQPDEVGPVEESIVTGPLPDRDGLVGR